MTGLAAIVFAIVDPPKPISPDHNNNNNTQGKVELNDSSHSDSVVYIFRSVDLYPPFCFGVGTDLLLLLLLSFLAFAVWLLLWRLFYVGGLQERLGIDKEYSSSINRWPDSKL